MVWRCAPFGALVTGWNKPVEQLMLRRGLRAITSDLRNRLLVLMLVPLCLLAAAGAWLDFRSAADAAVEHDQRLLRLLPALADSIVASRTHGSGPLLLLAPPVEQFLAPDNDHTAFSVRTPDGDLLLGDGWVQGPLPATTAAEFHSVEFSGVTYRVAVQRTRTDAGEMVVALADGSDTRQQWLQQLLLRVVLPNLLLVVGAAVSIRWAVARAFKPLVDLANAVERRSPRDLDSIDEATSPAEVRPLVRALNHLFALVHAQIDGQRRFVADAAHQLRTPLAGLQAQVEAWAMLASSTKSEEKNQSNRALALVDNAQGAIVLKFDEIEKLRAATRRTSQLAHQLLALSRADSSNVDNAALKPVELKELCEAALELHLDAAAAKDMDLGLEASSVQVIGHDWLLRELLTNLVDNAIKYAQRGGCVTIRCGRTFNQGASCAYLQVEDDGAGISELQHSRVLERFYRVPGTVGEGTGLGLPIANEIARSHGTVLQLRKGAHQQGLLVQMLFPAAASPPSRDPTHTEFR